MTEEQELFSCTEQVKHENLENEHSCSGPQAVKAVIPERACQVSRQMCAFHATEQERETQKGWAQSVPERMRGPRQLQSVGQGAQEQKAAQEASSSLLQSVLLEPSGSANHNIQYSEESIWGWRKKHHKDRGNSPSIPPAWDYSLFSLAIVEKPPKSGTSGSKLRKPLPQLWGQISSQLRTVVLPQTVINSHTKLTKQALKYTNHCQVT